MNTYLETGLSLILIFFIFSVIAYVIHELIAINLEYRGKEMYNSLSQLFDKEVIKGRDALLKTKKTAPNTEAFFAHPQINVLKKGLDKLPSYIPAANFSLALLDMIAKKAPQQQGEFLERVRQGLTTFTDAEGDIFKVANNLVNTSATIKELQQKIEDWYTLYMDRVTGWYKSHTLLTLRLVALGVTLFFNLDVISITKEIFTDSLLREGLVTIAENVADKPDVAQAYYTKRFTTTADSIDAVYQPRLDSAKTASEKAAIQKEKGGVLSLAAERYTVTQRKTVDSLSQKLLDTGVPLGWKQRFVDSFRGKTDGELFWKVVWLLLGWLIAAGCISMGAPFWFDLLVKVVNIRRAGIKPTANENKRQ